MRANRTAIGMVTALITATGLASTLATGAGAATDVPVQLGPATYLTRPAPGDATALAVALTKIGAPYRYGATGPDEFDCSGFTQWSFAQTGVRIPRTSRDQSRSGTPVPLSQIRRGDLVFSYEPVSHVGFYLGDGTVLHEPTTGGAVKITAMKYLDVRSARRY